MAMNTNEWFKNNWMLVLILAGVITVAGVSLKTCSNTERANKKVEKFAAAKDEMDSLIIAKLDDNAAKIDETNNNVSDGVVTIINKQAKALNKLDVVIDNTDTIKDLAKNCCGGKKKQEKITVVDTTKNNVKPQPKPQPAPQPQPGADDRADNVQEPCGCDEEKPAVDKCAGKCTVIHNGQRYYVAKRSYISGSAKGMCR